MMENNRKNFIPPHSVDSEQALIGALINNNDCYDEIASIVNKDDFYAALHKEIFVAIEKLMEKQINVDVVSTMEEMSGSDYHSKESKEYIIDIVYNNPGANAVFYAKRINELAKIRRLIVSCREIIKDSFNLKLDPADIIDKAELRILEFSNNEIKSNFKNLKEMINESISIIDERFNSDSDIIGLETGFSDLDTLTSGLNPGDFVIVAGRPSMGKTSFAMNIVENVVKNDGAAAAFSLEMPSHQLMNRVFSSLGNIKHDNIRSGKLEESDFTKLHKVISLLNEKFLYVDDRSGLTVSEIKSAARRMDKQARQQQKERNLEESGLDLIVIDYLQLMNSTSFKDNLTAQTTEISKSLKQLAKELNVPLIALSQLNRDVERRPNKRPKMSDLRESGAIEQDADLILFVYRDEVYEENTEYKGLAEIIVGKQRNGALDTIYLQFDAEHTRFSTNRLIKETY